VITAFPVIVILGIIQIGLFLALQLAEAMIRPQRGWKPERH
jgi:hypothetical protein